MLSIDSQLQAANSGAVCSMMGKLSSETTGELNCHPKHNSSTVESGADNVAKDFEAVFASMLLKNMRSSLDQGSLFGEDSGDVYGGMFDLYLGQQMSASGGFGLAQMVRESLHRTQNWVKDTTSDATNCSVKEAWTG